MTITEIKDAIHDLSEEDRRQLILELIPEILRQARSDATLRAQLLSALKVRGTNKGKALVGKANERVLEFERAVRQRLPI